ncbi:hypothetical protein JMG10_47655 [Nostoc ellipsosporum NOK]|uniref:CC0125/CC1285 family lipoprotein n=1 Tax=Sphingomonas sp. IBVSS2 TaxID=1985172 RepID=UPI000A2DBB38|nr:hypothetical protein [Sphingomonas sp. IBVSS2]MDF2389179.1 hypothetical protein [Nostoc ellipsosporum NOK]OSZ68815.1 hypothetical protein CAP40_09810 [Sphingomonas sp. IBVSS2]
MLRTPKRPRFAALALILAGSISLSACMTATPYQPATGNGTAVRNGYSDTQIESNRFRISFSGNSLTSRETVERYLLYRAAELTLQQGFDHFILSDRDTEKKTDIVREPGAWGPGPWGYWSPSWRFYRGPRWGWRSWDPFFDDPFWRDRDWDYRTVTQYEAMAEVVMGKGPKPSDNLRAFDAHEVVSRLGPSIQMPTTK